MAEKFNEYGQITNIDDAHVLANLENEARDAEKYADLMDGFSTEIEGGDSESLQAFAYEIFVLEDAEQKRHLADTALDNYVNNPDDK